jgi:hypothetical protein
MDNQDIINPQNSFNKLATLTLPKGTLTLLPPERWNLPMMAFSYGEAFHTEDPRIGNGTGQPTLLSPLRAYQLVFSKVVKQTQLNVTLRHVSNSQELAKIDPDTGLQQIVGASLNNVKAKPLGDSFTGVPVCERFGDRYCDHFSKTACQSGSTFCSPAARRVKRLKHLPSQQTRSRSSVSLGFL